MATTHEDETEIDWEDYDESKWYINFLILYPVVMFTIAAIDYNTFNLLRFTAVQWIIAITSFFAAWALAGFAEYIRVWSIENWNPPWDEEK